MLIRYLAAINSDNRRTQVLIKAIEANNDIDANQLAENLQKTTKPKRTPQELLNLRLLRGCIFTLIGLSFLTLSLIDFFISGCIIDPRIFKSMWIFGGPSLAIGISYLIVYFVTRKQVTQPKGE